MERHADIIFKVAQQVFPRSEPFHFEVNKVVMGIPINREVHINLAHLLLDGGVENTNIFRLLIEINTAQEAPNSHKGHHHTQLIFEFVSVNLFQSFKLFVVLPQFFVHGFKEKQNILHKLAIGEEQMHIHI